jgi:opacity protein-like surface antigen
MRVHALPALLLAFALFPRTNDIYRADVFGGYSWTRSRGESWNGWNASSAVHVNPWLGFAADVTGHYKTLSNTRLSLLSGAVGPRVTWGRDLFSYFVPFVQAQAGVFHTKAHTEFLNASFSENDTHPGVALGGGVDVSLSDRWALRAKADYVIVRANGRNDGDPRVSGGLVVRFGRMSY